VNPIPLAAGRVSGWRSWGLSRMSGRGSRPHRSG